MKELKVKAEDKNLGSVMDFVTEQLEIIGCPLKTQMKIEVAVEELFINIAHYAYAPDTGDAVIRVNVTDAPPSAEITFIDSGKPYDPLAKPDPDTSLPADKREIGGLGIYMVKKSMDEMKYEYRDGSNILTIVKNI